VAGASQKGGDVRRTITIAGPDGAGKTAVADALADALEPSGEVVRYHHRLRALPSRPGSQVDTGVPHDVTPYGRITSTVKVGYLFADQLLGLLLRALPVVRRGGWVIVERGWWDLAVDPQRYRLRPMPRLTAALGRLLPTMGPTIVLSGPAEVLHQRKQELDEPELARQLDAWAHLAARVRGAVVVDVDRSLDLIVKEALEAVTGEPSEGGDDPVPARVVKVAVGDRQWTMPVTTTRAARASFDLFQPMRPRSRVAWSVGRQAAGLGLLGRLPETAAPELPEVLAAHIPAGGSAAVIGGKRPERCTALVLDRGGHPRAIAKVALDEHGATKLAHEVHMAERARHLLEAPLSTPRVLEHTPGLILFEPVRWAPRRQPWRLPPELARGLGRLHAAQADADGGPGHGDLAPWNVMRSARGWHLIDWEDGSLHEPAFDDPFHHIVQSLSFLGRPTPDAVLAGLRLEGDVGAALRAYAEGAELGLDDLEERFVSYLRRSHHHLADAPARLSGLRAREDLLARLGQPLTVTA
jgi:thymidylate kinase